MLIVDVGALRSIEHHDRPMWSRLKASHLAGELPMTHGGIVGAVWRGEDRTPVVLARALGLIDVVPFDVRLGRAAGSLVAVAGVGDVMAAGLTLLARNGDVIVTSQPTVITALARVAGLNLEIVATG